MAGRLRIAPLSHERPAAVLRDCRLGRLRTRVNEMDIDTGELSQKQVLCWELCRAVRKTDYDEAKSIVADHQLRVEQAWKAPRGEGYKCVAARFVSPDDGRDVLVVAFRSTYGNDEWLEYTQKYWKRRFVPHAGVMDEKTNLKVLTVWSETLEEVWTVPGEEKDKAEDTLRDLIWRQLNAGNKVWLAGHSKGGAVATTAAARLMLGDSIVDAELPDPAVRRPSDDTIALNGGPLSRLSVITFNAPMAFTAALADRYDAALKAVGAEHVRFEHRADRIRKLPPDGGMKHVGDRRLQGEGVAGDPGVLAGAAIAAAGVAVALAAGAAKIARSH